MADVRVRGAAFASGYVCFERLYGTATAKQLLMELPDPEFAAAYAAGVERNGWYRFLDVVDLWKTMEQVGGEGTVRRVSKEMAIEDLNGFLRAFLAAFGTPAMLAGKASNIWKLLYEDGELTLVESTPTSLLLELRDYPTPNPLHCAGISGWIEGALNQTRVRGARMEHRHCRAEGAARCEFLARWGKQA